MKILLWNSSVGVCSQMVMLVSLGSYCAAFSEEDVDETLNIFNESVKAVKG